MNQQLLTAQRRPARTAALSFILTGALSLLACDSRIEGESAEPAGSPSPSGSSEATSSPAASLTGSLTLVQSGSPQVITVQSLHDDFPLVRLQMRDSYYHGNKKTYVGVSLPAVLKRYARLPEQPEKTEVLLTAADGYTVRTDLKRLLLPDAVLALGHKEPGSFEPIGDQGADARPLYLVWSDDSHEDEKEYPRPWSLARIEFLSPSDREAHTKPPSGFGDAKVAAEGYKLFSKSCIRCHSINQEGGKMGPDLNVPQNILAYRPEQQVRAYIKNPGTFRYSSMPAHPDLTEGQMDSLIAYLRLMGEHQFDPHKSR